ncbi:wax ester synthase/diacylglycerol acyltransferase 6-like [Mangifera indica]|uniref:wax ester synthase/diacylglycerol acyltransferase 6-like n=1 Tax=Mangifera indica TaxID=29780 RepID=UPI001CFB0A8E|nr:wax ester synthase/diacylglycerol acyltransferase 6-like [Mangifera indica]
MQGLKPIKVSTDVEKLTLHNVMENQPLSPMARMFHEPDSNVYIMAMIGLKTEINAEVVKANLVHTLVKHPRFSSLQVVDEQNGGRLIWLPTEVNLDNHVVVPKLDPNSIELSDKFVEDYISNLSKNGIKMSIPMWDIHLLNVKTSDAESVAVLRVHHSLGDGTSLMSLFLACTRKVSNPEEPPTIPMVNKANSKKSSRGLWGKLIKLWLALLLFWNTLVDVVMFLATTLMLVKDTETPLKGPLGVGTTPRRFVHRSVSLDDIMLIKNTMRTTINDVMLGVTQAGLSRYLNRKYGESIKIDKGASERRNNLPKNIRLRATFFMNLRPSPGIQELADMMKKGTKAKWGNQIGYLIYPFTIALRDNPLGYLREAKAAMDRKKASLEASFSYFLAKYFLKFGGMKMASFPSQTTLWFSNVAGPKEEISLFGHPVAYIAPSCFGQPNGLMIHVVSYVNKMTFILSVDDGIIPDPHQLCDDLEESLNLIKTAIINLKTTT